MILARVAADEAEILTLAVHPASRRRGLGRRLLAPGDAHRRRRGAAAMFLEVAADQRTPPSALYAARGLRAGRAADRLLPRRRRRARACALLSLLADPQLGDPVRRFRAAEHGVALLRRARAGTFSQRLLALAASPARPPRPHPVKREPHSDIRHRTAVTSDVQTAMDRDVYGRCGNHALTLYCAVRFFYCEAAIDRRIEAADVS